MLSFPINVAPDEDPEEAAREHVLWRAHVAQVHLTRPISLTVTRTTESMRQLASILGLEDNLTEVYRVDAKTNDCPGDHTQGY
ncbi:hypothetical protein [Streptomyces venezuelae]|uniref:Uncharacterized protein n=1 Tax=Streptomyces venezuelae TaxID=54571 RepID=A0A5P2B7Q6_STRVZ|nr:hypothetical protein [Streptomyces venezuelae]QES25818.1 hypothetical protein DEJ47_04560 [Streptomyces venezuelae]